MVASRSKGVLFLKDMTGGLNNAAPIQDLRITESPDCLDVDFGRAGGVRTRDGVRMFRVGFGSDARGLGVFSTSGGDYALVSLINGTQQILEIVDGAGPTGGGGYVLSFEVSRTIRSAIYGNAAYVSNCQNAGAVKAMRKWTGPGVAPTILGSAFVDNYTAPTGGNMPFGSLIASHAGYMWVADTIESGTAYGSRLRFSHPLRPEDWHSQDYIDVDFADPYDAITAIVSFSGALVVFKRRGVYAVYGTDATNFSVERLGGAVGAVSQEAVTSSPTHLYWWSTDGNVMSFDGRTIASIGDRIVGPVRDGLVLPGTPTAACGWDGDRLHVCAETTTSDESLHYVFDPAGRGFWTRHSWAFRSTVHGRRRDGSTFTYFFHPLNGDRATWVSKTAYADDRWVPGPDVIEVGAVPIRGHWTTAWLTTGDTATFKRWRRSRVTAFADSAMTFKFQVFHDYDDDTTNRQFNVVAAEPAGSSVSKWDLNTWDDLVWATSSGAIIRLFEKLPNLGKSHAVMLRVSSDDAPGRWVLDSIAIPYEKAGVI